MDRSVNRKVRKGTIGALAFAATAGHLAYPAWLWLVGRERGMVQPQSPAVWPPVSVVVPAFREAGVIADKIRDLRSNGYQGELEIIIVADGDPETAAVAEENDVVVISTPHRLGKAQGLNRGVASARHEIIVLTDANNRLSPEAIASLVRWFGDLRVGAVAGEKREHDEGESSYWRFESWLKRREAMLGTTIGLVGELAAVRAKAWEPIPPNIGIDDLWIALDMAKRGYKVMYEPLACAYEPEIATLQEQWERRTRNVAGALNVFAQRRSHLHDGGGIVAVQVWGHRLWRYTGGPAAHLALIALALRRLSSSRSARLFIAGHLVGALVLTPPVRRRSLPAPIVAGGQIVFLQAVAVGGWWRYMRGDRGVIWITQER